MADQQTLVPSAWALPYIISTEYGAHASLLLTPHRRFPKQHSLKPLSQADWLWGYFDSSQLTFS